MLQAPLRPPLALPARSIAPIPLLVVLVVLCTALAFTDLSFMGFSITGYAWAVPLFVALADLATVRGRVSFPIWIWSPWIAMVLGYLCFADADHAFQRSIMMLAPLVVGMAASKRRTSEDTLVAFRSLYRVLAIALLGAIVLKSGFISTRALPEATPFAPEVMSATLLCCLFASSYALGQRKDLRWWGVLALVPLFAVTRMGILAAGSSLPLTLAPLRLPRRVIAVALMVATGLAVFTTDRVQRKTFKAGHGEIEDLVDDRRLATSGRALMWEHLRYEISHAPWFGHGSNASEEFVWNLSGSSTHPHNDWLRIRFDYGNVGACVYALCLIGQVLHLLRRSRRCRGERRTLLFAGASSFIPYVLFMMTDNILLYAAFFGNLQYTILGLVYSAPMEDEAPAAIAAAAS